MADLRAYENLHAVVVLKSLLRRWWRLEIEIADAAGEVPGYIAGRLNPPGNEYCRHALFSVEGRGRCAASVREAAAGAQTDDVSRPSGTSVERRGFLHRCHMGFIVAGAPVSFDGRLAGFLFAAGAARDPLSPDDERVLDEKLAALGPVSDPPSPRSVRVLGVAGLRQLQDLLELAAQEIETHHAAGAQAGARLPEPPAEERIAHLRFGTLVGSSPPMQKLYRLIEKIVTSDSTVLIGGESGTGKELVARAIHLGGPRAKRPFVVQNCSAFNDNLLESALFGHVRGAFTGAVREKKGLFEVADSGTFFLDEVGDMSAALQTKLLRVLQEGTVTPVGSNVVREVDVRVMAATHKDLERMVERGEFREDLYYRLNVIRVELPPLRERADDLPLLIDHFLKKHFRGDGRPPRLAEDALLALRRYGWPGNIRELENEIERMIVLCGEVEEVTADMLSVRVREAEAPPKERVDTRMLTGPLKDAVESLERDMIREGLIRTRWNKSRLAKDLGISRSSLIAKVQAYGFERAGGGGTGSH